MKQQQIGYREALSITLNHVAPIGVESVPLAGCTGRVVSEDLVSLVDSPSVNASLKDGFAVRSAEIADASPDNPVRLKVISKAAAGVPTGKAVTAGTDGSHSYRRQTSRRRGMRS